VAAKSPTRRGDHDLLAEAVGGADELAAGTSPPLNRNDVAAGQWSRRAELRRRRYPGRKRFRRAAEVAADHEEHLLIQAAVVQVSIRAATA